MIARARAQRVAVVAAAAALLVVVGCRREERRFRESPPATTPSSVRVSALQPGTVADTSHAPNPYESSAYAQSEGQRLFGWYNCAGCHANGGGGMGPALMDDEWIYGSSAENIYNTIVQGRPNGMPSFAGKIPSPQIWQLVTYVRSLSGLTPMAGRSARAEHMNFYQGAQSMQGAQTPKNSYRPPASEFP
jgi:cytochrome c oxidase cbb3-type subunit 3